MHEPALELTAVPHMKVDTMTAKKVLLGIDLGTTGVKVIAFDPKSGTVVRTAYTNVATRVTEDGGHEQEPEAWWSAVVSALAEVLGSNDAIEIAGVGLSGHMHSLLLLDSSDKPIAAAMTWADRRVSADTERLSQNELFKSLGGNSVVDAFTAPKLSWMARTRPKEFQRATRLVMAKDYIGFRLTGTWCTDKSDAIGTLLYDLAADTWSPELFEATGASVSLGLEVKLPWELRGEVTRAASLETGLPLGTSVVAGAGDVTLAALGAGVFDSKTIGLNIGTAAQAVAITPEADAGDGFLFGAANGRDYIRMSSVYSAGASIDWAKENILSGQDINELADESTPGSQGLTYLPFMFGSAAPRKSDSVRAAFFGLSSIHGRPELASAVLEGVAFACADAIEVVASGSSSFTNVHLVGGVANSKRFQAALSSSIGADFFHVKTGGSALGAAITAGLGLGIYSNEQEAQSAIDKSPISRPDESTQELFREARARYQSRCEKLID